MRRKHLVYIALLLILLAVSLTLTACKRNRTIVEINKTKLTLDDFLYDIYLIEQERELWNVKYKESLGVDYWDYEINGVSLKQLAKDTIMTRVVLYDILAKQATAEGYTLSSDELAANDKNVDSLIASMSDDELKRTGMNRDMLSKVFNKLSLGDKYYTAITDTYEIDEEAIKSTINPDEYREYQTECLYVPTADVSYQSIKPFDQAGLDEAYDKIQSIRELISQGADFNEVQKQVEGAILYSRSFIPSDTTAEDEYKEAAKELENGAYSDIITTKFGHYIIHMLNNNSPARYEKAIQDAIQAEKTVIFKTYYDELLQDYDIEINTEYWSSLDIGSITNK